MHRYLFILFLFFYSSLIAEFDHIHPNPSGENRVGKISIDDRSSGINQGTWIYVKNALDYYKKNPPLFLILELNTPGGEVFSAQKISDALKDLDTQYDIPVVAYINNWAISAGAMLAYSSRYIVVVKDASMGAAEPVLSDPTSGEMKTASEKINSALRADFASRAEFFGRNPYIAEAMVDKDIILVKRDGKIIKVDSEKPDDIVISPKGKLLTLNSKEMIEFGVANLALEPTKIPQGKEPLLQAPYFSSLPNLKMDAYHMDWKTQVFVLLANPFVTSALMLGMMLGAYTEFNHPGFGLPAIGALCCLFLLTLSSFSLEIADWLEVILMLSGFAVILLDLVFLPTFGLLGFIGLLLFLAGFLGILLPGIGSIDFEFDTYTFNAAGEAFFNRLGLFFVTLLVGTICILILARYMMPSLKTFKRFVLEGNEQVGYHAGTLNLPKVGSQGKVVSVLRPSGKVEVEGEQFDAISTGRLLDEGDKVVVVGHDGSQLIVKEVL
jgi:membrane-bound serine protease (ClpP class)